MGEGKERGSIKGERPEGGVDISRAGCNSMPVCSFC